jgi:hypothetical protein
MKRPIGRAIYQYLRLAADRVGVSSIVPTIPV